MKKTQIFSSAIFLLFLTFAFVIDRVVKYFALEYLKNDILIVDGVLKLSLQKNTGIAFSIGLPIEIQYILFPVLACVGLYCIIKYFDLGKLFVLIASGSIAGAALGNFFDRVFYGHVIDYISVSYFPVFNFADIIIVCGIFLIIVFYDKIKRVQI
ncbi:signal peptidase II [Candidatus Peregrinibacteria bacterium]|nr:signal peptidase II [Candidatus Peregrinibacteria bacterium]